MSKKKKIVFFLALILITNCSFDNKTGIWDVTKKEEERIVELEKNQDKLKNRKKIFSSENIYTQEIALTQKISISNANKNSSWKMSNLNHQNFLGNLYLSGTNNIFLKKKIGKNKFSISKIMSSPLVFDNNIILSDNTGTIFNINQSGNLNWKINIYEKIYKKVFKNLVFSIYKNNIYIADNVGFIYSININDGKVLWIKNHGVPLKSNIKVLDEKIFLINQDNRAICLNVKNGSKVWDIRLESSFIKSQNFLSSAISTKDEVVFVTSSGDLIKSNLSDGKILWSTNTLESTMANASDFFKSSKIVIDDNIIIFSAKSSIFSFNINSGYMNWKRNVSSIGAPIIDGKNIFIQTVNGYFVILDKDTGSILSSTNILKILNKSKKQIFITGFVMGSEKIYSTTSNGYLIVASPITGKVENFMRIGDPIVASPVISNGKLYILTQKSRLVIFN